MKATAYLLGADQKVDTPQRSAQDVGAEALLVLPDLRRAITERLSAGIEAAHGAAGLGGRQGACGIAALVGEDHGGGIDRNHHRDLDRLRRIAVPRLPALATTVSQSTSFLQNKKNVAGIFLSYCK